MKKLILLLLFTFNYLFLLSQTTTTQSTGGGSSISSGSSNASKWTTSGNDIYNRNTGGIGINTSGIIPFTSQLFINAASGRTGLEIVTTNTMGLSILSGGGGIDMINTSIGSPAFNYYSASGGIAGQSLGIGVNISSPVLVARFNNTGVLAANSTEVGFTFEDNQIIGAFTSTGNLFQIKQTNASTRDLFSVIGVSADLFKIKSDGRVYGTALHNNAAAVTGTTNQYIASGTYTATITDSANTSARTAFQSQWTRVGNVVTVSGVVDIDPTSTATTTIVKMTLPIASNFTAKGNCRGTATAEGIAGQSAAIIGTTAYATSDFAIIKWVSGDVTNQPMSFTFTYLIL